MSDVEVVELDHPRFQQAWTMVFTSRVVADCFEHQCSIKQTGVQKLEACCQYGCDVDLFERDAILARADQIKSVLRPEAANAPWFDEADPEHDPDVPSGTVVRTQTMNDGCIFLQHDRRGCAIHRASLEQGWDFRGTKPSICRLFPLSYEAGTICVSDDYVDYSCAYEPDAPTLYRVARDTLADVFGPELVRAMDAAEARLLAAQPKRLPVV